MGERVHRLGDLLERHRVRLAGAQHVGVDVRLAADEPLHERLARHLEREHDHRLARQHRRVARDVQRERCLADRGAGRQDDQLAGLQALGERVELREVGGHAGDQLLVLDALLEGVPPLADDRGDVADLRAAPLLADLEDRLLGLVDRLLDRGGVVEPEAAHLAARLDEPPPQRVGDDDVRVVAHARGARHHQGELGDVVHAAGTSDARAAVELVAQRDGVDRLAAIVERERGPDRAPQ